MWWIIRNLTTGQRYLTPDKEDAEQVITFYREGGADIVIEATDAGD